MDIEIIQDNIEELENADTTFDNVRELALLYIVRNNLKSSVQPVVIRELHDIFPAYQKYVEAKQAYQRHISDDSALVNYMQLLCQEIREFMVALYAGTDLRKERHYIEETLSTIQDTISKY